jgi:hypothetical protein
MQELNLNINEYHKASGSQSPDSMNSERINNSQLNLESLPSSFES